MGESVAEVEAAEMVEVARDLQDLARQVQESFIDQFYDVREKRLHDCLAPNEHGGFIPTGEVSASSESGVCMSTLPAA